jgi:hypothetical protein
MSRLLYLIPFFCLFPSSARAEAEPSAKGLSIRLFAVALAKDQGPVCFMIGQTRTPAFEIPTTNLSQPIAVSAREFTLISAATPPDATAVALATLRLPDQGSDFRIILVPTPDQSYKPVIIRGDDSKFAHGDFFFINLSTHEILGALGSARLTLKPGGQEILRPSASKSDKFFEVKIARRAEDKILPLTNTCWPIVRDNRSFVIFYNATNGRPTYRAVDEFMALAVGG